MVYRNKFLTFAFTFSFISLIYMGNFEYKEDESSSISEIYYKLYTYRYTNYYFPFF